MGPVSVPLDRESLPGAKKCIKGGPPHTSTGLSLLPSPQEVGGMWEAGRGLRFIWLQLLWFLIALHSEMKRL